MKNRQIIPKFAMTILYIFALVNDISYSVLSIIAICLHELSHIILIKINGINNLNIKFSPLGFSIDLTKNKFIKNENFIYFVGSVINIFLGIILFILWKITNNNFILKFSNVNLIIGFINLMPAFPLDGATILRNFLFSKLTFIKSIKISLFTSLFISLFLFLLGIIIMIKFSNYNITYLFISGLIFLSTYREYKFIRSVFIINSVYYKGENIINKGMETCVKTISVLESIKLFEIIKKFVFNKFLVVYIVDSDFKILGITNEYIIFEYYKKFGNIEVKKCLLDKYEQIEKI